MTNPDIFRSRILLTVEREITSFEEDFTQRELHVNTFNPDGTRKDYFRDYNLMLDKIGPRIMVRTWISSEDMKDLSHMSFFNSIVMVDAPGIQDHFIVEMVNGGEDLELTHNGQRLFVPKTDVLASPGKSVYDLGRNLDQKMVRVAMTRYPERG